ncbi:MotA/TolQ/ExbB proton channel family protein [Chlorobium phaeovibrioides]|uniref:MotA/TolQ/ExbB proton channel family protein n=2 Tax=Chlorobium phaeovibrioides TaxID=1094 RepID=A0A3S0NZQ8_CHLPH|nr:MotA/TolQ/ExbB proton channel family protein [Chlorobium phaeovibrioides]MWV53893.1 MotA/TolQ/ExbB proton channel family protein [Chlorobium phaeovibrioides]QEQ56600.1 MotA/TolQ/ExbB proton channel family protein [Chlorobium phaeovibrioides]RTY38787.1 MotA/TolQ/ExbB proton channel family protein [Chlorobium phaeovibrioides]HCD36112.1 MotA/TolQ/ExbB proton channel family protein [Chlorobium sp.]
MKQGLFTGLLILAAYLVSLVFYLWMGTTPPDSMFHAVSQGGPVVSVLMALILMVIAYAVERVIALNKAAGQGNIPEFVQAIKQDIDGGDVNRAIARCDEHQSSLGAVIRSVLDRYNSMAALQVTDRDKMISEMEKAVEEATTMEMPLLEKNLVAISTIASISTMVGLLGTTLGMIRAFQAMATSGAPDAVQLSLGISEALFNTALGIVGGILGIVTYNIFTSRVDRFSYLIDEAAFYIIQTLGTGRTR